MFSFIGCRENLWRWNERTKKWIKVEIDPADTFIFETTAERTIRLLSIQGDLGLRKGWICKISEDEPTEQPIKIN